MCYRGNVMDDASTCRILLRKAGKTILGKNTSAPLTYTVSSAIATNIPTSGRYWNDTIYIRRTRKLFC